MITIRKNTLVILLLVVSISCASFLFQTSAVETVTQFSSNVASKGVNIDGDFEVDEWSDAQIYSFSYNTFYTFSGNPHYDPANDMDICVKNDVATLYLAVYLQNVQYASSGCVLKITWDVDDSGDDSEGDFRTYICSDEDEVSDRVWTYESNDWKCCSPQVNYKDCGTDYFVDGYGDVVFEISIALSNFNIISGGIVNAKFEYDEDYDSATIYDLTTDYVAIQTASTLNNFYGHLDKPIITSFILDSENSSRATLNWNSVPAAQNYYIYETNIAITSDLMSSTWDDRRIANVTADTTSLSLINNGIYLDDDSWYYVIAVGVFDYTQSEGYHFIWFESLHTPIITAVALDINHPMNSTLTWGAVEGAKYYYIYRLSIEISSDLTNSIWDDDLIAIVSAEETSVSVVRIYENIDYDEWYYVVAVNDYDHSQSEGYNYNWFEKDLDTGFAIDGFSIPMLLIMAGLGIGIIFLKKRN